ncbi:MAG: GAF domain-containing protein [Deltaproteobacteria bacterium]|nr:GAF domain-containing protein [Deltaproteobacteria bacterium]MBW2360716.1 GAF domain-containing protein [Deltaproteobacteria bacterium]
MRRIRIVGMASLAMCGLGILSIAQHWYLGATSVCVALVLAMAGALLNLELLRRLQRPIFCGHIAVGILTGILVFSNANSGGFYTPGFAWLYVVPFTAVLVIGPRGTWPWLGAVLAITLGFWSAHEVGMELPNMVPAELRPAHALFNRVTTILGLGLVAWSFVSGQRRAGRQLARANVELRREAAYVQLLEHAATAANEAVSLEAAMTEGVRRLCQALGWVAGHIYVVNEEGNLVTSDLFHDEEGHAFEAIRKMTRTTRFAPGEGMPGRALASAQPEAVLDLATGGARAQVAKSLGMQAAYAIPVPVHGEVVAVIECGSRDAHSPNPRLLEVLQLVGIQLGRVGERTALQERLRQSQRLEAVGRLAAGVAHEINNPMAYVRSNLNQLHGEWKALRSEFEKLEALEASAARIEDCEDLLEESLEGVERTVSIVREMKEMSHSANVARDDANLGEIIEQAIRIASARAPLGVHIEVEAPPEPIQLVCAASQLRQVFVNLVANAIDAIGDEGTIRISSKANAGHVVTRFEDDGPGMTEDVREHLFDPFFTTKPVGQGTGLGLAISHEIVNAHGGEIRVQSTAGNGACIEVHLPVRDE